MLKANLQDDLVDKFRSELCSCRQNLAASKCDFSLDGLLDGSGLFVRCKFLAVRVSSEQIVHLQVGLIIPPNLGFLFQPRRQSPK